MEVEFKIVSTTSFQLVAFVPPPLMAVHTSIVFQRPPRLVSSRDWCLVSVLQHTSFHSLFIFSMVLLLCAVVAQPICVKSPYRKSTVNFLRYRLTCILIFYKIYFNNYDTGTVGLDQKQQVTNDDS